MGGRGQKRNGSHTHARTPHHTHTSLHKGSTYIHLQQNRIRAVRANYLIVQVPRTASYVMQACTDAERHRACLVCTHQYSFITSSLLAGSDSGPAVTRRTRSILAAGSHPCRLIFLFKKLWFTDHYLSTGFVPHPPHPTNTEMAHTAAKLQAEIILVGTAYRVRDWPRHLYLLGCWSSFSSLFEVAQDV